MDLRFLDASRSLNAIKKQYSTTSAHTHTHTPEKPLCLLTQLMKGIVGEMEVTRYTYNVYRVKGLCRDKHLKLRVSNASSLVVENYS